MGSFADMSVSDHGVGPEMVGNGRHTDENNNFGVYRLFSDNPYFIRGRKGAVTWLSSGNDLLNT